MYEGEPDVRAFTKHDVRNRAEFGMNELLYDATVCRTRTVRSARGERTLHYVAAPLWHVESELAADSRQALFDFNKLVVGAAPFDLFVGPFTKDPGKFIEVLRSPAACCVGRVFVALIPHPRGWSLGAGNVMCEELAQ